MQIIIIADDLTGANDSAAQFAKNGFTTAVVIYSDEQMPDLKSFESFDVLVFDSESRDTDASFAYDVITSIFDYVKSSTVKDLIIYKKVDSTLRGNIGTEIEALIKASNPDLTIFAPAFIEAGRTTQEGFQYLHGTLLENTELANIPKSPVSTSYIPAILAKNSKLQADIIPLAILDQGYQRLITEIDDRKQRGQRLFSLAAVKIEHLTMAARAGLNGKKTLFVGSAGLALALSEELSAKDNLKSTACEAKVEKLLFLCGSVSEVSRRQSHVLVNGSDCALIRLDLDAVIKNPEDAARQAVAKIKLNAALHKAVLVTGAYELGDIDKSKELCDAYGISFFDAGELVARTMGKIMSMVHQLFDGFVMTGGDCAVHAAKAAYALIFSVKGEIESGIACCNIETGPCKDKVLASKAGAFGKDGTFLNIYNKLVL